MPSAKRTDGNAQHDASRVQHVRREQLAINLADLDRLDPAIRSAALAGKLDVSGCIKTDAGRPDEAAVLFTCDLLAAACICDTIRSHDRASGVSPTRIYVRRVDAWQKLAGGVVLSVVEGGIVRLNPAVFPDIATAVPAVPLRARPLSLAGSRR